MRNLNELFFIICPAGVAGRCIRLISAPVEGDTRCIDLILAPAEVDTRCIDLVLAVPDAHSSGGGRPFLLLDNLFISLSG